MTDTNTPAFALPLDDLLEASVRQADAIAAEQARQASERELVDLRTDRAAAKAHVRNLLSVDTPLSAWERLESPHLSRTVLAPFDDPDLALAYRHRSVTAGGPVLTVLARATDGEWVGSTVHVHHAADLARAVEDARDRAEAYDDRDLEDDLDELLGETNTGPAVRVTGESFADVLAKAVAAVAAAYPVDEILEQ